MGPNRILIAGVSTRAVASSAARAGFDVVAIDAFGDLDQHPGVRTLIPDDGFSPDRAAELSRNVDCDLVAYLAGFENAPRAVAALARDRWLLGNGPGTLARVRDPWQVARSFLDRNLPAPRLGPEPGGPPPPGSNWLLKPLRGGGGHGVRYWEGGSCPPNCYLQERIDGVAGSVVFVAARGRAVPLGVSQQLIGEVAYGASGFRYCGSLMGPPVGAFSNVLFERVAELSSAASAAFGLVGVNGIDFVVASGVPYAVEVNPRWSASVELVERALGREVFGIHARACLAGELPDAGLFPATGARVLGKAVVFARENVRVGDSRVWLDRHDIHDVPPPGSSIRARRPVCTVFSEGESEQACRRGLEAAARGVYLQLGEWTMATP